MNDRGFRYWWKTRPLWKVDLILEYKYSSKHQQHSFSSLLSNRLLLLYSPIMKVIYSQTTNNRLSFTDSHQLSRFREIILVIFVSRFWFSPLWLPSFPPWNRRTTQLKRTTTHRPTLHLLTPKETTPSPTTMQVIHTSSSPEFLDQLSNVE